MALEFKIVENIMSVRDEMSDMTLELNIVSWNGRKPKYDIRRWNDDHTSMSKGITLTESEVIKMFQNSDVVLKRVLGDAYSTELIPEDDEPLPFS